MTPEEICMEEWTKTRQKLPNITNTEEAELFFRLGFAKGACYGAAEMRKVTDKVFGVQNA